MSSAERRGVTLRRYSEVKPLRKYVTGISFEALLISVGGFAFVAEYKVEY